MLLWDLQTMWPFRFPDSFCYQAAIRVQVQRSPPQGVSINASSPVFRVRTDGGLGKALSCDKSAPMTALQMTSPT